MSAVKPIQMKGLSREDKEEIARRAATLQERLDFFEENDSPGNADDLVSQWREYVAGGDTSAFEERLDKESLTVDQCERLLSRGGWPAGEDLPEWVAELDRVVAYVQSVSAAESSVDPPDDVAFSHLLAPVASYAEGRLSEATGALLTESARAAANEWLVGQLSILASHTLFIEFRTSLKTGAGLDDGEVGSPSETGHYDEFVARTRENVGSLFLEYSFLGRLVVTTVNQWVAMLDELSRRVVNDSDPLRDRFSIAEVGTVADVDIIGDPLPGGRHVVRVTFGCGTVVAYKPRNATIAAGFANLLEWLDEHSSLPRIATAETLCRPDYSWMEWIVPSECRTRDEVAAYYRRAGVLVFLFYATNAVDVHLENIIAEGAHPVVIDLETIAHPAFEADYRLVERNVDDRETVLRTGAVADPTTDAERTETACFATNEVRFTSKHYGLENVNTDGMELERNREVVATTDNLPTMDGEVVGPDGYVGEIVDGFEAAYRFFLENRDAVLGRNGSLRRLLDPASHVRVLYRNNQKYAEVRRILTHQPNLKDGLQFGVKVESLAEPILAAGLADATWETFERARDALRRWNEPRFTARLDGTDLYYRGETVLSDALTTTPLAQIERQIRELGEADLERQKGLLRDSFEKSSPGSQAR